MEWHGENLKLDNNEKQIMKLTSFLIPKVPGIEQNVVKAFNLYRFFQNHLDTSPNVLARKITVQGLPLFNSKEISEIQNTIRRQSVVQSGGGTDVGSTDTTRQKFWDNIIHKLTHTIGSLIPFGEICKNWEFYIFFLYALEQMEFIGPFVSTALDSITLSLPVLSDLTADGVQTLFMLLPIPYAGLVGDIAGFVIGTLFILFAVMLNINRKYFGSAFKVSLELIPMFGDILAEAATNFEVAMERAMARRAKILDSIKPISPTMYSFGEYYIPSDQIHNWSPPQLDSIKNIGNELQQYAQRRFGVPEDKMKKISNVASKVMNIGPLLVNTITSLPSAAAVPDAAAAAVPASNMNKKPNAPTVGGRQTRRKHRRHRRRSNKCK